MPPRDRHAVDDEPVEGSICRGIGRSPGQMGFAAEESPPTKERLREAMLQMLQQMQPEFVEYLPVLAAHARATAQALGLTAEVVEQIGTAAELHDVGKLTIPETLL